MGWHMKRGLAADVPIFAGVLVIAGGLIAVALRGAYDLARRHRAA